MAKGSAVPRASCAFLVAAAMAAAACSHLLGITGSGIVITKPITISSFTRLEVASAFKVNLSVGDQPVLTVRIDDNLVTRLDVHESADTLNVGLTSGTNVRRATLEADLTVSGVSSIDLSGASQLHLNGQLAGQKLDLALSGASAIDGPIQFSQVDAGLSGASQARLTGSADRLMLDGSGASLMPSPGLTVRDLEVTLSGASQAVITVNGTISADLSGASLLRYGGSATFTKKEASGGSIIEPLLP